MSQTGTKIMMYHSDCAKTAQRLLSDHTQSIQQYKTPKTRPESSRAGLSYTVASIGFVTTKPERLKPKGAFAPVTPNTQ